jgi:hypothetical protein
VTVSIPWLVVGGPLARWTALGLVADESTGRIPFFGTGLEITDLGEPGMIGWVMSGVEGALDAEFDVDGVPTRLADPAPPMFADHPLGVDRIDHVVVSTDDLVRTCGAIADVTGEPLKRVREAGAIRQGFHRVDGLIVEVVERAGQDPGPATLWGFVLTVADLDASVALLGEDVIGEPRDAVQPGRRIATVRSSAGLGVPLALMSPHVR